MTALDVADDSLTGGQIDSASLGTVPEAAHARNADQLGGSAAADFRLHCPSGLYQAGDLCYELTLRPDAFFSTALVTCARAQLRLPDPGELALVFDHLGADQHYQWVASFYFEGGAEVGALMGDDVSRQVLLNVKLASSFYPYRCVTSISN